MCPDCGNVLVVDRDGTWCPVCFPNPVPLDRIEEDPDFRPYLWDLED